MGDARRRASDPEDLDPHPLRESRNNRFRLTREGLEISGRQMITALIVAAVAGLGLYGLYLWRGTDGTAEVMATLSARMPASKEEHLLILGAINANTAAVRALAAEAQVQTWLLSQPQQVRPELVMPPGLAGRLVPPRPNR